MTAEQFNDAVAVTLPDPTDEPQETILDLPETGWGALMVGDRLVRSVMEVSTGYLYVEASIVDVHDRGLSFPDGEGLTVMEALPVVYQGVPWTRMRVDVG